MKSNSYPTAFQAPPPTGATARPLPAKTAQYGLTYQLLLRNAFVALYKIGVDKNERFEVFTIRRASAQTFKSGSTLPARELLPKDSDFGRTAFCCLFSFQPIKVLVTAIYSRVVPCKPFRYGLIISMVKRPKNAHFWYVG